MHKIIVLLSLLIISFTSGPTCGAQFSFTPRYSVNSKPVASITFHNSSDYTMKLRIVYASGGYYTSVSLPPHSSRSVNFSKTNTFKLKIKATSEWGHTSYHDGGKFSVTCNDTEWTEGIMTFEMSSYGSGLGPSISAKQFESDN